MAVIKNIVGEPDTSLIPKHILPGNLPEEVKKYFEFGYSIDRQGIPATLEAVANNFNKFNNASVKPDQIIMADGARSAATVAAIYIRKKHSGITAPRVLLIKPGYNLYNEQFADLGFSIDQVYSNSVDEIRKKITSETLIIPITNPNNPTGEIYSEEFLQGLLKLVDEFPNLHIISDSVYDRITRVGVPAPKNIFVMANSQQQKRVFEVNGLAKSFSYPAIRVGWLIADESVAAQMQEIKDPMLGPLNNIAQVVAITALKHTPANYHEEVKKHYDARLALVHNKLRQIDGFRGRIPDGTFYYWANFTGVKNITAEEIVEECAKKNIFLAAGEKFGEPNAIRINCGAGEKDLEIICDEIISVCRNKSISRGGGAGR